MARVKSIPRRNRAAAVEVRRRWGDSPRSDIVRRPITIGRRYQWYFKWDEERSAWVPATPAVRRDASPYVGCWPKADFRPRRLTFD